MIVYLELIHENYKNQNIQTVHSSENLRPQHFNCYIASNHEATNNAHTFYLSMSIFCSYSVFLLGLNCNLFISQFFYQESSNFFCHTHTSLNIEGQEIFYEFFFIQLFQHSQLAGRRNFHCQYIFLLLPILCCVVVAVVVVVIQFIVKFLF